MTTTPTSPARPPQARPHQPRAEVAGLWFRRITNPDRPRVRLVCCPHAGGTAGAYHGWGGGLPADVQVLAVRYPGRQDRLGEPAFTAMEPLADAVADALAALVDRDDVPLALFGHSMGASVAHEVSRRLDPLPQLLMVSGRRPPHLLRPRDLYRQGDEALVAHVQGLGEVGTSVLAEPELRELILPAIRADYTVVGTYRPDVLPPIAVPIVAYGGAADVDAPPADLARWAELSSLGFALRSFPGGHFYLQHAQRALIDDVALRLEALHTSRT